MGDNVTVLHENDKVEIFPGIFVEVFETPGHDKSCLTYKVENNVFSGDSYILVLKSLPHSLIAIGKMHGSRKNVSWN